MGTDFSTFFDFQYKFMGPDCHSVITDKLARFSKGLFLEFLFARFPIEETVRSSVYKKLVSGLFLCVYLYQCVCFFCVCLCLYICTIN